MKVDDQMDVIGFSWNFMESKIKDFLILNFVEKDLSLKFCR